MRSIKGWVCDRCGSENRMEDTCCLACLHKPKKKIFKGFLDGIGNDLLWGMIGSVLAEATRMIRYILAATMVILTLEAVDILIGSGISAEQLWYRAAVRTQEMRYGVERRLESAAMLNLLDAYIEKLDFYLQRY